MTASAATVEEEAMRYLVAQSDGRALIRDLLIYDLHRWSRMAPTERSRAFARDVRRVEALFPGVRDAALVREAAASLGVAF